MLTPGESFGWAFRDPQGGRKLILQGLIGLIPIVGQIAAFGWVMQCLDNLRSGRQELAEPGFPLGRGIDVWLPLFVLGLIAGVIPRIPTSIGGALVGYSSASTGALVAGGILVGLGNLLELVLGLAAAFLLVSLFATAYEGGMGAAFNYPNVIRRAIQFPVPSVLGIVATFIAGIGAALCYVGLFLTYGYGMSIIAGLLTNLVPGSVPGYGPPPGSPYGRQPGYAPPPGADVAPANRPPDAPRDPWARGTSPPPPPNDPSAR